MTWNATRLTPRTWCATNWRVRDADSGQLVLTLKGHLSSVTRVSFSPDGKRIVSGSIDKTLKIWVVES